LDFIDVAILPRPKSNKVDRKDVYAAIALREDLVGPISSHITPIRVIDGNEMPGAIRSMCVIEAEGVVWVGCESGKIIRFRGDTGDILDVLTAHTECITAITSGLTLEKMERIALVNTLFSIVWRGFANLSCFLNVF
jgi:hypothetical protein